jgi:drug/metabolite transporter (DMT)-like permease|tara:strand:+ start:78 stop:971 length:894 start_codon:yes stop_codon:yes gene_type:complete
MSNKNWLLVISLGIIWGSSFLFVEILLNNINPWMIVFLRVSIASIILISFCVYKNINLNLKLNDYYNISVMSLLNNVIPFLLIVYGQKTTTGGLASIINSSTAFFSIILASILISEEKLNFSRIIGVIIGVVGVIITIGYDNLIELNEEGIGPYYILLATISYSFAGIWAKVKMKNISSLLSATGMTSISAILLFPIVIIYHQEQFYLIDQMVFKNAMLYALCCSVFAYLIYFKILETTGAGNLLICTIIVPASAFILNYVVLGEQILSKEIFGIIIISIGLIILDGRILNYLKVKA